MFKLGGEFLDSALALVHASAAAYQVDPTLYEHWPMLKFDRVDTFPTEEYTFDEHLGSTHGFVASNDQLLKTTR